MDEDEDILDLPSDGPELEELDDEMRDLIMALDDKQSQVKLTDPSPNFAQSDIPLPPLPLGPQALPRADELQVSDVRTVGGEAITEDAPEIIAAEAPLVDLRQTFEQMDQIASEIIQAARSDRQEAQDVINLFRNDLQKAVTGNLPLPRGSADNIVKALEVKASVNMTVVKAMEAKTKLLAATKAGGVNVNVNNVNNQTGGGTSDRELIDILASDPIEMDGADKW